MLKRKLLILEMNEVPWRIIDKFVSYPELKNIKYFFDNSKTYTTIAQVGDNLQKGFKLVYGLSKEGEKIIIGRDTLS